MGENRQGVGGEAGLNPRAAAQSPIERTVKDAQDNDMKRLAIFAHYDGNDEIQPYILFHVRALREVCDEVIFVSTARLSAGETGKIRPHCAAVLLRENIGYDFGMWKHALQGIDVNAWDELVLTNSSVFGPLFPLRESFDTMAGDPCDFWGMTGNHEIAWHLQSYFLAFRRRVLHSASFAQFWRSVQPHPDKSATIRNYEVGLTGFLEKHGFRAGQLIDLERLRAFRIRRMLLGRSRRNPVIYYPVQVIRCGMPYLKVAHFRTNPRNLRLDKLCRTVEHCGYDKELLRMGDR
jgi:lipopolysaccharide biosynthesis protein